MKTEPSVFDDLQRPVNWAYMATALQKASSLMDWTRKKDITDWRYVPIYRMLIGFSLENLLKGILIAEGNEVMKDNKRLRFFTDFAVKKWPLRGSLRRLAW